MVPVQFAQLHMSFFALLCAFLASIAVNEQRNRKARKVDSKKRKAKLHQYL
jgi:hypothetical protein